MLLRNHLRPAPEPRRAALGVRPRGAHCTGAAGRASSRDHSKPFRLAPARAGHLPPGASEGRARATPGVRGRRGWTRSVVGVPPAPWPLDCAQPASAARGVHRTGPKRPIALAPAWERGRRRRSAHRDAAGRKAASRPLSSAPGDPGKTKIPQSLRSRTAIVDLGPLNGLKVDSGDRPGRRFRVLSRWTTTNPISLVEDRRFLVSGLRPVRSPRRRPLDASHPSTAGARRPLRHRPPACSTKRRMKAVRLTRYPYRGKLREQGLG